MKPKIFHIGDVLSVITGRLVAPNGAEAVYDLLTFMMAQPLRTHQLRGAAVTCAPVLLQQHPQLRDIVLGDESPAALAESLAAVVAEHGETLSVTPIHPNGEPPAEQESHVITKASPDHNAAE